MNHPNPCSNFLGFTIVSHVPVPQSSSRALGFNLYPTLQTLTGFRLHKGRGLGFRVRDFGSSSWSTSSINELSK